MAGEKFLMMSENPTGTGSFSLNRRSGSTVGTNSHTEGNGGIASGIYSHAEGNNCTASAISAHAEGNNSTASGAYSHAEGTNTTALGQNSHAQGSSSYKAPSSITADSTEDTIMAEWNNRRFSLAKGQMAHVEGGDCLALASWSHAEGQQTRATGSRSRAQGHITVASADSSFAGGYANRATNYASSVLGKFNASMTDGATMSNTTGTAFVIGNGTADTARANAFSIQYNGIVKAKSTITASTTADYAEFFEWLDGNPEGEDRVGYFVTLEGDKIRIANSTDEYILGVVSGEPFVLGNGDCDTWVNIHLRDKFRRTIYEPAPKLVEILDDNGLPTGDYEEVPGEYEGVRPKLNPEYDPGEQYISRFDRPEWAPVGMLGVLAVRHDGSAQVNGYVTINEGGIATACDAATAHCYRVIKSNADDVVEIIFTSGNGIFVEGDVFVDGDESGSLEGALPFNSTRNFILIGDSYLVGYTPNGTITSWGNYLAAGIPEYTFSIHGITGSGFGTTVAGKNFLDALKQYTGDKNSVTDILVCGGYNDAATSISTGEVLTGIANFVNYVKTNFVNAKIHIGYVGASSNGIVIDQIKEAIRAYRSCGSMGCGYISNMEYTLRNTQFFTSDKVHPNQIGQKNIAWNLISYLTTGNVSVIQEKENCNVVSPSTVTAGITLHTGLNNSVASLYHPTNEYLKFSGLSATKMNGAEGSRVTLGTLTNSSIIGNQTTSSVATSTANASVSIPVNVQTATGWYTGIGTLEIINLNVVLRLNILVNGAYLNEAVAGIIIPPFTSAFDSLDV